MTRKKKVFIGTLTTAAVVGLVACCMYVLTRDRVSVVRPFDDVRFKNLRSLDLSSRPGLPDTLWFNETTVWPKASRMPSGRSPQTILSEGMNPGLGVRELHRQGVTGKGVNVAIIDLPMYADHPEFAGKVIAYHDLGCGSQESSMHGSSVTSLLIGANCGSAPDARVYYAATPGGSLDAMYDAKALDWVVEQNSRLPTGDKIRLVSVSAIPSGLGAMRTKNTKMWDEACARAEAAGIMVLDGTRTSRGFVGPCWYDPNDPENVSKCTPGYWGPPTMASEWRERSRLSECILAPCAPRTMAEEYNKGEFSYHYCGTGGLSLSIPYCAGVLAMGWQVNSHLTPGDIKSFLFKSAYLRPDGARIIDPKEFIRTVIEYHNTEESLRLPGGRAGSHDR